ncbi:hypothetical protein C8Q79DRAFT_693694 [Trametes meyenii]|nr:hypothetical protein C8Q79DRAFT_693694 [Trametes meyenii]
MPRSSRLSQPRSPTLYPYLSSSTTPSSRRLLWARPAEAPPLPRRTPDGPPLDMYRLNVQTPARPQRSVQYRRGLRHLHRSPRVPFLAASRPHHAVVSLVPPPPSPCCHHHHHQHHQHRLGHQKHASHPSSPRVAPSLRAAESRLGAHIAHRRPIHLTSIHHRISLSLCYPASHSPSPSSISLSLSGRTCARFAFGVGSVG